MTQPDDREREAARELYHKLKAFGAVCLRPESVDYERDDIALIATALEAATRTQAAQPERDYRETVLGVMRFLSGQKVGVSTGIDESITYGYGELDEYGFWEYPVPDKLVELGRQAARCEKLEAALERIIDHAQTYAIETRIRLEHPSNEQMLNDIDADVASARTVLAKPEPEGK